MYEVVTIETIKPDLVSKELNISIDHVKNYISNYDIYKKYPIRDLTFQEQEFIRAIRKVKTMSDNEIMSLLEKFQIKVSDLHGDQLYLEKKISNFNDESQYAITRKYQHFILEPAILYNNFEAPITRAFDMENIVVLLSNIAMGITSQGHPLDPKVQIAALSKIADIYTTSKVLTMNTEDAITSEDLNDLSPKELTKLINHVKTNKKSEEPEKVVSNPINKGLTENMTIFI